MEKDLMGSVGVATHEVTLHINTAKIKKNQAVEILLASSVSPALLTSKPSASHGSKSNTIHSLLGV
jgi:hypothetical protein